MYGFWILVIVFTIVGISLIIFNALVDAKMQEYKVAVVYRYEYSDGYWDSVNFCNSQRDRDKLTEEEYIEYLEKYKKYQFWKKVNCNGDLIVPFVVGVILLIAAFILIFVAIFVPMGAASEVAYWSEFAPMVENTMIDSNPLQDIGITEKIVEYNSWLAKARSSQEIYKNFSVYYGIDLSALEYIKIGQ
jgi:hypothetical protein